MSAARAPSVLVVDDRPEAIVFVIDGLERAGVAVDLAPNAEAALSVLAANTYDLVLIDLRLPKGPQQSDASFRTFADSIDVERKLVAPGVGQLLGAFLGEAFPSVRFIYLTAVPETLERSFPYGTPVEPEVISKGETLPTIVSQIAALAITPQSD